MENPSSRRLSGGAARVGPEHEAGIALDSRGVASFEREVSVLVVRGWMARRGPIRSLKMCMKAGFFARPPFPADVTASVSVQVATMAEEAVRALDGVGVFCVELFLASDGRVLINEVAPRPHNSGTIRLDACTVCNSATGADAVRVAARGNSSAQSRRHAEPHR